VSDRASEKVDPEEVKRGSFSRCGKISVEKEDRSGRRVGEEDEE